MGIDNAIYIFFILWTPVMIFVYIVDFFSSRLNLEHAMGIFVC